MSNGEFEEQIVKEGGRGNCGQYWSQTEMGMGCVGCPLCCLSANNVGSIRIKWLLAF